MTGAEGGFGHEGGTIVAGRPAVVDANGTAEDARAVAGGGLVLAGDKEVMEAI